MPKRKSGMMSPAAIARAERELRAVELRRRGMTFEQIAVELHLANRGAAHKLVRRGLTRWMSEPCEELRALELERTETISARL
jgi:orotate phosphoribosyltransferase-like protein